ncbi:MAG: hypothetical protein JRG73_20115 [Deltaproteobacteria bacterium]|nr:hypothetical protein [Deltaproteobacteria bacterium]MBW2309234.1 hypothetical protein [Deltaproteobacteria bacterium]
MNPEERLQEALKNAGLSLEDELIKQLLPMYQRWQNYIQEAREVDVKDQDPAHVFCPKHW